MNVLVVGGNKFVGAEIVARLLADGRDVTMLALDPPREDVRPHVRWVEVNRDDEAALAKAFAAARFDAVVDNIARDPLQIRRLRDALRGRLGRYVLTSSVDLYGMHEPREPREEDGPLEPSELEGSYGHERYIRGKRACEKELAQGDMAWVALRPAMVTGRLDNIAGGPLDWLDERDWPESSRSLHFPARVLDGGPVLLRADDRAVFRLAWAPDVARAVSQALADARLDGRAFNVAGDELWTSRTLVEALAAVAGRDLEIVTASTWALWNAGLSDSEPPYGRGPYWSAASNAALRAVGWRPTPPAQWMARLLECAPAARRTAGRDLRVREIALARHLQRVAPPPLPALPLREPGPPSPPRPVRGHATGRAMRTLAQAADGLARAEGRRPPSPSHWREHGGRVLSSLGLGTYPGAADDATDELYREVLLHAVPRGLNVIDTAPNYRGMRAERLVGRVVRELAARGVPRQALCIATKGGFLPHDAQDGRPAAEYLRDRWVRTGLAGLGEAARGHALSAKYIAASLALSLENLGLAHVDVYFLHNPELARPALGAKGFERALTETFAVLEEAAAAGRIGAYGLATWDGLRVAEDHPQHVDLGAAVRAARIAADGDSHHLRFVQLPLNAAQPEALVRAVHTVGAAKLPAVQAAQELGLYVFTSASALQGRAATAPHRPRAHGLGPEAAALLLARSAPGVGTALVGTRRVAHAMEALEVAAREPLPADAARTFFP